MRDVVNERLLMLAQLLPYMKQQGSGAYDKVTETVSEIIDNMVSPFSGAAPITQRFGNHNPKLYKNGKHLGLDVKLNDGTPILAPMAGKLMAGYDPSGWGNYVKIVNGNRDILLGHLRDYDKRLIGKEVNPGTLLGYSGNTGKSTGSHLDITARENGQYVDPLRYEAIRRATR